MSTRDLQPGEYFDRMMRPATIGVDFSKGTSRCGVRVEHPHDSSAGVPCDGVFAASLREDERQARISCSRCDRILLATLTGARDVQVRYTLEP